MNPQNVIIYERYQNHIPRRQAVFVHALVATIRTGPEPSVFLILDGLDEVLAHLLCRRTWISVLAEYHTSQLFLVPLIHSIRFLVLFYISRICIKIFLGRLPLHSRVMAELALFTLFTEALFEKGTKHGLRIDTKGHLLRLQRLKQLGGLTASLFSSGFVFFLLCFCGFFAFLIGGLA